MKEDLLETTNAFDEALFPLLKQLQSIKITKDADNPFHKSRYASLPSVLDQIMPVITENEFMHKFKCVTDPESNTITVKMEVIHMPTNTRDEVELTLVGVPANVQQIGSFQTYARRYLPVLYYNLNIDDDDDGNLAAGHTSTNTNASKFTAAKPTSAPVTHRVPSQLKHKDLIVVNDKEYGFINTTFKSGKNEGKEYKALADRDGGFFYEDSAAYKNIMAAWAGYVDPEDVPF